MSATSVAVPGPADGDHVDAATAGEAAVEQLGAAAGADDRRGPVHGAALGGVDGGCPSVLDGGPAVLEPVGQVVGVE